MFQKLNRLSFWAFLILAFLLVYTICKHSLGWVINYDVLGYYLYLPAIFVYNDLGLQDFSVVENMVETYQNTPFIYQAVPGPEGSYVMKYSMGLAILYLPFFLIAHCIALLSSFPADGFSLPYQYAITAGGTVYMLMGIWFLRKVLLQFFNEWVTAITLVLIVFGTNYYFHNCFNGQNGMSHNYLFTLYAFILWQTIRWHQTYRLKHMVLLAVFCGLTILSRPSEIVCLFIPLLWGIFNKGSLKEKWQMILRHKHQLLFFVIILLLIGFLQFTYWKIYAGKFLYYSYEGGDEKFVLLRPYILEVLFSYKKGWLLYTPLMVLAILGFIHMFKSKKSIFWALLVFFVLNIWVVSSWSNWWYAESFGQRALIQSYAVMALPLAAFIEFVFKRKIVWRVGFILLLSGLICLNLFQSMQSLYGILHPSRMSKAYYWEIFGSMKKPENAEELLLVERGTNEGDGIPENYNFMHETLKVEDFEHMDDYNITTDQAFSGQKSFYMDSEREYSRGIEIPYHEITDKDFAWLRVSVQVYPLVDSIYNDVCLVFMFDRNGQSVKWQAALFKDYPLEAGKWNTISFDYLTPEVRSRDEVFKTYVWHKSTFGLYMDDLKIEVFEPMR